MWIKTPSGEVLHESYQPKGEPMRSLCGIRADVTGYWQTSIQDAELHLPVCKRCLKAIGLLDVKERAADPVSVAPDWGHLVEVDGSELRTET